MSALLRLMAWSQTGNKLLPEPVMAQPPKNIGITQPHYAN